MERLCCGCMRPKQNSPVCELCGYDENSENLSHQLRVGSLLQNRYLVGKVLGQGGFGITYIGLDQFLSTRVAIKEYYPGGVVHRHTQMGNHVTCDNGEAPELFFKHREKFLKEARVLAQLGHIPEIVQIKNFFAENNTAYIVMEYVQGITLKEYLKNQGRPMTEKEVLAVMEPVLRALQKVHDQNLIHRDISPDNIMLPQEGGVKIIDFGTVRYVDDSGKSKSTETILKPGFAPMEQYNTHGKVGTWTDVYALCASFHYLLTGKVPLDVHERMDEGEELFLLRGMPGISRKLINVLERGMKIRYAERIQTVSELYHQLYNENAEETFLSPETVPAEKKKQKSSKVPLTAALVAVLLAGLLLWKPNQGNNTQSTVPGETMVTDIKDPREEQYEQAVALLESGEYEQAAAAFAALGDYKDSQAMVQEARNQSEYAAAEKLLAEGNAFEAAKAFYAMGDYRDARERCFAVWDDLTYRETISAELNYTVGVRTDGTVVTTGISPVSGPDMQSWTDIIAVSAGEGHIVGLRSDGTVVAAGENTDGQCDVSGWRDIVAISTADHHTVGLKADGTVVAVGYSGENDPNPTNRTYVDGWTNIVAVSTGNHNTLGLRADGTVLTTRSPNMEAEEVTSWRDVSAIDAANWNSLALREDGTAVAAGTNKWRQCDVSGWDNLVSISGGFHHTVGLKQDGTVVAVGSNSDYFGYRCGQLDVSDWRDIVFVTAGDYHTIGLRSDGTVVATGRNDEGQSNVSHWCDIRIP